MEAPGSRLATGMAAWRMRGVDGKGRPMAKTKTSGAVAKDLSSAKETGTGGRDRQRELTAASLDLFAKHDFASVTIKDIASASGVNTALIYYYFQSKEDLFRACIEDAITQAMANYDNIKGNHAGGNPVDLIEDWFDTNIEMAATIRKLVKIMIDYAGSETQFPSIDRMIKQFYDIEVDILSTSIRTGVENGLFRAVDADRAALFVSSHLDGIMVASMIRPDFKVKPAVADLRRHIREYLGYGGDNHGPGSKNYHKHEG